MNSFSPVLSHTRIAILIDGDHIPASFRPAILKKAMQLGDIVSTQLFCDISVRQDWATEPGLDIHHCKGRPGKNCTDMQLCIAALDLAYRNLANSFLIVSNDRDFEPLIRHLTRIGLSARQQKLAEPPAVPKSPPAAPAKKITPHGNAAIALRVLTEKLTAAQAQGGLPIASLGGLHAETGFHVSLTPEKTWRKWLTARPEHCACDAKGPTAKVRRAKPQTTLRTTA